MPHSSNRLMLELEKVRREINRDIINPQFPLLGLEDLKPLLTMVAHARADYVKELHRLASESSQHSPSIDEIKNLRQYRETFEELVTATNALETIIQREYLDLKPRS